MNAVDCCSYQVHVCTCNWDDGGNTTARRHLDANYAFPIHLGKGDAQGKRIHQSGTLKVAVQGIRMVALAPNYRHNSLLAAIAVPFASLALSAVAAFVENIAISRGATDRQVGVCRLTNRSKPLVRERGRE